MTGLPARSAPHTPNPCWNVGCYQAFLLILLSGGRVRSQSGSGGFTPTLPMSSGIGAHRYLWHP
jgi:hypothetical protein